MMPYLRRYSDKCHHHDSETYIRCRNCGTRTPELIPFNAGLARTMYCPSCVCNNAITGEMCSRPRAWPQFPYCYIHLRCATAGCILLVKEHNPTTFHWCLRHSCVTPHCPSIREAGSTVCAAHKCLRPDCVRPRHPSGRSQYCASHTCEDPNCGNQVDYEGAEDVEAGDPRRFCDLHRRCGRADCARRCYMYDDGNMAPFCGEHRCQGAGAAAKCGGERGSGGGQFCEEHSCQWSRGGARCWNGSASGGEGSRYCADHECARESCQEQRDWLRGVESAYCRDHKCRDWDCGEGPAGATEWCERHQPCSADGCRRQRVVDGETVTAFCERHTPPTCAWLDPRCTNQPVGNGRFCEDHTCILRNCPEERDSDVRRAETCTEHRCTVDGCPRTRQNAAGDDGDRRAAVAVTVAHSFCSAHGCQERSGRCTSRTAEGSRFCDLHSCAVQGCPEEARLHGNRLCPEHALARQERIRDAAAARELRPGLAPAVVDPVFQVHHLPHAAELGYPAHHLPTYGQDPGVVPGGGMGGYGFGMPPAFPRGATMPGMGYQYGPGQTGYHYRFL